MNYKQEKYAIPYLIVFCVAVLCLLAFLSVATDLSSFILGRDRENVVDLSDGWEAVDGTLIDLAATSSAEFGGEVHVTRKLPDQIPENFALCITSNDARFDVTIDHKNVYSFDTVENLTGFGYGRAYHVVALSPEDAGKTVELDFCSVYTPIEGGRLGEILLCSPRSYRHLFIREHFFSAAFSTLVIFFGILMLIIQFMLPKQRVLTYNLTALGAALILLGLWCLADTGLLQFTMGIIYACEVLDYLLIHLAVYPMIRFVNSTTRKKRPIYNHLAFWISYACLFAMLFFRFSLGIDMAQLAPIIYISYFFALALIAVILVDDRIVCKKLNTPVGFPIFYIGMGCFIVTAIIDVIYYRFISNRRMVTGYGHFFRFGLIVLLLTIVLHVLRWWSKDQNAIERDRIINRILQVAMSAQDADSKINSVLEYLCIQFHADRAYIFEDQLDGTFDNTYEWCRIGVHPEIANLQNVPYDNVIEVWYNEYKKNHHILIDDLEKYRPKSEKMYQLLKPQGIRTLVTGPLEIEGKYVGFYGVDNPPVAYLNEVSELLRLISYVFAQMVSQRDEQNVLLKSSYHDEMTGVKNRRALDEFEADERDRSKPFGYLICAINGLKHTNDTFGHDAGDSMIIDIATALAAVFGYQNVYRMGGDEFVIYDFADNEKVFLDEIAQVRKYIEKKGRSVSIGHVYCPPGVNDIREIRSQAEEQVYAEKRSYYNGHMDRRVNGR